jgi:tetratricopeptide (TPR) repeat protein
MERIELGQEIICRYALNFFDAYLKSDPQSLAFLQRKPDDNGIPAGFVVLASSKPPLKAIPTAEQLANMIATNGTWNAIEILRDVKKSDPNSDLLQERALNSLGYRLIFIGKLSEAIEVFKLNVDMYPQSFNVYDSLAEAYMIDGEKQLAIKNYERSLELNPNNTNATEKLKTLR